MIIMVVIINNNNNKVYFEQIVQTSLQETVKCVTQIPAFSSHKI